MKHLPLILVASLAVVGCSDSPEEGAPQQPPNDSEVTPIPQNPIYVWPELPIYAEPSNPIYVEAANPYEPEAVNPLPNDPALPIECSEWVTPEWCKDWDERDYPELVEPLRQLYYAEDETRPHVHSAFQDATGKVFDFTYSTNTIVVDDRPVYENYLSYGDFTSCYRIAGEATNCVMLTVRGEVKGVEFSSVLSSLSVIERGIYHTAQRHEYGELEGDRPSHVTIDGKRHNAEWHSILHDTLSGRWLGDFVSEDGTNFYMGWLDVIHDVKKDTIAVTADVSSTHHAVITKHHVNKPDVLLSRVYSDEYKRVYGVTYSVFSHEGEIHLGDNRVMVIFYNEDRFDKVIVLSHFEGVDGYDDSTVLADFTYR